MKKLINLTPHFVYDLNSGLRIEPAKNEYILRVKKSTYEVETIMGSSIYNYTEELLGYIPMHSLDKVYIVSKRVADAMQKKPEYAQRDDFIYPVNMKHEHIEVPIKDENGKKVLDDMGNIMTRKVQKIKGCYGFERAMEVKKKQ